jgi:hypothetical protein
VIAMKKLMFMLWLLPSLAAAQGGVELEVVPNTPATVTMPATPPQALMSSVERTPPNEDVIIDEADRDTAERVAEAWAAAQGALSGPTLVAVTSAISAVLWLLINLLRRFGAHWLKGNTIRWLTLGVGALAWMLGEIAAGLPWWQALYLGISGPGAIVVDQLARIKGATKDPPNV